MAPPASSGCVLAIIERSSPVRSAKRSCSRLGKVGSGSDRRRIGGNGPESVADGRFPGPRPERNCPSPATCRSGAPRSQYPSCCPGPPNLETAKVAPPPRHARAGSRVFSDFRLSEVRSVFAVDSGRLVLVPTACRIGGNGPESVANGRFPVRQLGRPRSPTDDSQSGKVARQAQGVWK